MGLDSVEFLMAVEKEFGLEIADADAEQMTTPRLVVDHLAGRLPALPRGRIEESIRRLISDELGIDGFEWDHSFVDDLGVD